MTLLELIDAIKSLIFRAHSAEAVECLPSFADTEATWWLTSQHSTSRAKDSS